MILLVFNCNTSSRILLYVGSLRELNYEFLIHAMKNLMKWVFSFDHYNCAQWAAVHLFDLVSLHWTCPNVYARFLKGNFSFQKSNRRFSKMALDLVHEQNNGKIKCASGATHLLNRADVSGLGQRKTCTPEIARIIESLEENIEAKTTEDLDKPHHEDRTAFQRNFAADFKKVYDGFDVNPFEKMNLVNISNTSVSYDEETRKSLKLLLSNGEAQFQTFLNEQLIDRTMSIDALIKKKYFTNDAVIAEKKKLICDSAILNKIRESIRVRTEQANELFKTELFDVPQSTAENTDSLYHSRESDILKRFPICNCKSATDSKINNSAIIIDFLLFTKSHAIDENTIFLEFADSLRKRILNESSSCLRCDIIADRYFKNSLKQNIRSSRGLGSR